MDINELNEVDAQTGSLREKLSVLDGSATQNTISSFTKGIYAILDDIKQLSSDLAKKHESAEEELAKKYSELNILQSEAEKQFEEGRRSVMAAQRQSEEAKRRNEEAKRRYDEAQKQTAVAQRQLDEAQRLRDDINRQTSSIRIEHEQAIKRVQELELELAHAMKIANDANSMITEVTARAEKAELLASQAISDLGVERRRAESAILNANQALTKASEAVADAERLAMLTYGVGSTTVPEIKLDISPKSLSPLNLAFIGDAVYGLLAKRLLLSKGSVNQELLHRKSVALVCAKAQSIGFAAIVDKLSDEEMAVYKRGRNSSNPPSTKSNDTATYKRSTGVEALFGYLYLSGQTERMLELFEAVIAAIREEHED